ncbi:MAG: hypothetical protein COZ34_03680 [Candidatus Pacebacteria bacterium CG_4_10_14_3_um_filter_34_15]|nr:MAG: hypothetical protein COV78_01895 [Candidatus Pacebacteria bacterium CG11_big_fil_rev_8_21_14_0_20_34_55]PIX81359.1 MAG: hypothetical protein COZ34_03680 [Candidatus Pacebacteria bacterium CG_4_10_14_3_um_filter_34_15]PJC43720.1 MAG: hypothetical protein CO039_02435 [Candidatus Pacebacteria bacterium CG_4_9_14_0_2_um_filter_34_50]
MKHQHLHNNMSKGFSLIEVLIVLTIFAILSIAIIVILNPIEQINRGRDISLIQISETLSNAASRYLISQNKVPWNSSIQTTTLSSSQGQSLVANIISLGELKQNFVANNDKFEELYITTNEINNELLLCFQPHSKAYQQHPFTIFSQNGDFNPRCFENRSECYFCFGNYELGNIVENAGNGGSGGNEESNMTEEELLCRDFEPEYPKYPWTCNSSDKLIQYGCTNYCVADKGCDGYCAIGQRHLIKSYYATNSNVIQCLLADDVNTEEYCVADPFARCDIKSYNSDPSDYAWGCTNPRRPYKWAI